MHEKGTISVHTENIFPIIKKFLYTDEEVFLRELVANAVDATQKLKQLAAMGKYEGELKDPTIQITLHDKLKTITIRDQGLGMTAEELKKYINQIAFSGATAFVEKYQKQADQQQLIGCFGLGFYAAFMVANKVEIITKSYQEGAQACHWTCDGTTQFTLTKAVKKEVGTDIVLHMAEDAEEFLKPARLKGVLEKHCRFMPIPIAFEDKVINHTNPLWIQAPQDLQSKDYLAFYKSLYPLEEEPLFWIHLNVDYPFHLTGVLYFPRLTQDLERHMNKIQLYARQVFITDEVKEVVPEFLLLLHGVIDSPDIPLNVSRSALQTDNNVRKIHTYITKKVAEKLGELFKADRKAFEEKWDSIYFFVKYGMLVDDKFYDKAVDFALLKNTAGKHFTLAEYQAHIKAKQTNKEGKLVLLYATDAEKQDLYIQACQQRGYDVLLLESSIDGHFINLLEQKLEGVQLKSVDTASVDQLMEKADAAKQSELAEAAKEQLKEVYTKAIKDQAITWEVAALSADELPVVLTLPEFAKRLQHTGSVKGPVHLPWQAVINTNHALAQKLLQQTEDKQQQLAERAYHLALLAQGKLQGRQLTQFIRHSLEDLTTNDTKKG